MSTDNSLDSFWAEIVAEVFGTSLTDPNPTDGSTVVDGPAEDGSYDSGYTVPDDGSMDTGYTVPDEGSMDTGYTHYNTDDPTSDDSGSFDTGYDPYSAWGDPYSASDYGYSDYSSYENGDDYSTDSSW